MDVALLAAMFVLGLATGIHCTGMCGGIVAAFSAQPLLERRALWRRQLGFNLARIVTYSILGAGAGAFGAAVLAAGAFDAQRWLFVGANAVLVLVGFELAGLRILAVAERLTVPLWRRVQPAAASLMRARPFAAGLLWGLLPCGFVYGALAASTAAGGAWHGAAAMLAFGLGTLPWLLAAGVALAKLRARFAGVAARFAVGGAVLGFGVWGLAHASAPAQSLRVLLCI
jgi:sulfite exporter TauE/SafE